LAVPLRRPEPFLPVAEYLPQKQLDQMLDAQREEFDREQRRQLVYDKVVARLD
jgi:hypothetical protein